MTLLMIYIVSAIVPALLPMIGSITSKTVSAGNFTIGDIENVALEAPVADASEVEPIAIATIIYTVGAVVLAFYTVISIGRLIQIVCDTVGYTVDGHDVKISEKADISPFSFGSVIVMAENDLDRYAPLIILHEESHIRHRHWIDILIAQFIIITQWYNPVAWMMMRDLRAVHEYQADNDALSSGTDVKEYQMMLVERVVRVSLPFPAHSLNNSNLKKRIIMMNSKTSVTARLWRPLLLVPALAAAVYVTSLPAVGNVLKEISAVTTAFPGNADSKATPEASSMKEAEGMSVYSTVDKMPAYPGGEKALMSRLSEVIVYPEAAFKEKRQGRVVVKFIVDKNGDVVNPEIVRSVDPDLDKAALEAVTKLEKFGPGEVNGRPVNVYFTLPISFSLKEDSATSDAAVKTETIDHSKSVIGDLLKDESKQPAVFIDGKETPYSELSLFNTDNIESISVLKNNPKYPNGVIMITTK